MATYTEIRTLYNDSGMRNKIAVAIAIAADTVMRGNDDGAPFSQVAGDHVLRVAWAREVFGSSEAWVSRFWEAVLAKYNALTVSQITGASSQDIQLAVNEAVDLFAGVAL